MTKQKVGIVHPGTMVDKLMKRIVIFCILVSFLSSLLGMQIALAESQEYTSVLSELIPQFHAADNGTDDVPEPYMTMCLEDAEKYDLVVIAPRFDYPTFSDMDGMRFPVTGLGQKDRITPDSKGEDCFYADRLSMGEDGFPKINPQNNN